MSNIRPRTLAPSFFFLHTTNMDAHVHNILQNAGVAKGLTQNEVFLMMAMGSSELLTNVIEKLGEALQNKEITVEEYHESVTTLKNLSLEYRKAHQNYLAKVKTINEEEVKENTTTIESLQKKLDAFLSSSS